LAPNTFHNWVDPEVLNLTCVDTKIIGLIGSAYFLGFAISSSIIPPISKQIGRKWPYLLSVTFQLSAYILIFLSKNIWLTILGYLMVGFSAGGRVVVGLSYMCEFVPQN
jgi:MFS family permease